MDRLSYTALAIWHATNRDKVQVPIIASGGAGKAEDFVELFQHSGIDAGLAASIFHHRQVEIGDLKRRLQEAGLEMRL